jgi:hypothetical protein
MASSNQVLNNGLKKVLENNAADDSRNQYMHFVKFETMMIP